MRYVKLGSTGLDVSRICLGCMSYGDPGRGNHPWSFDEEASRPFIKQAVEDGINFFDTANVYSAGSSEEITGKALREYAKRDEIVLATKVHGQMRPGPNGSGLSRKAIFAEIDASLTRLGTDYVDLYQIHRWDRRVPIEETLEALHDVVKSGKARYIGASSMWAWQFSKAQHLARATRVDPLRLDAEPLQPDLPGGGAGDAPALRRRGGRCHPLEPAGPGPLDPRLGRDDRPQRRPTTSAGASTATRTRPSSTGSPQVATARGVSRAQVALGLDALQVGDHRPDHRGDQAGPPERRGRRGRPRAEPPRRSPPSRSPTSRTRSPASCEPGRVVAHSRCYYPARGPVLRREQR